MSNKPSSDQIIQGTMGSYLQMPYNRYLWLRLEFMAICNDEIEAKIMRIVEYEIEGDREAWFKKASALVANGKPYPPAPEQWFVTLSYKQFMTKMYGTVKNEKTIIAKLNSLVKEKKYLQKRADPENPYGAPQYTINREVVQAKLDKLPSLPMVPDVAKLYSEISSDPVPATGTPPNKEGGYQLLGLPVPATGTPSTSYWDSPVPATGTPQYQLLVHNKNKENTKKSNIETKEESIVSETTPPTFVADATPSPSLSQSSFSDEETRPKTSSKKKTVGSPEMPPPDASWPSRETAVQIVEAKKGRLYSTTTRKQELAEAAKVLEMTVDGSPITREQFEGAWDDLASSSWWDEHGKPCMIKYLRRDDAIVGIIKKLKRKSRPASPPTQDSPRPSFIVSDERKQRNIERLRASAEAKGVAI